MNGAADTVFAGIQKTITTLDMGELDLHDTVQVACFVSSLAQVDYIFVRIGTSSANYNEWRAPDSALTANEWNIVGIPIGNANIAGGTGTGVDWGAIAYIAVGVAFDNQTNTLTNIRFDQLGVFTGTHVSANITAEVTSEVSSPNVNVKKWGSTNVTTGAGNADTGTLRVVLATDQAVLSVDDNAGALTVDWAGTAPPIGAGTEAAALRVTLATDSTGVITVDNAGTFATQVDGAALTALEIIDNPVFVDDADFTLTSSSVLAAGVFRDDVTVDASGTAGDVHVARSNDQGALWVEGAHIDSTDDCIRDDDLDQDAAVISANAGVMYGCIATNLDATPVFVHFYNVAAASVTVGTTVGELTICIPSQGDANGAAGVFIFPKPLFFDTAASMAATTTVGGNTGPGTNELFLNVWYRDI